MIVPHSLSAQRVMFIGTIPLRGRIELQEKFSLEVKQRTLFQFDQELAGTSHEIATYEFYSNSPEIAYQLRLSPGEETRLGEDIFAFRNVDEQGRDTGKAPIPFKLSVLTPSVASQSVNPDFTVVEKSIGVRQGSRYEESGAFYVSFPTQSEGFDIQSFSSGYYEASITVEVSAD